MRKWSKFVRLSPGDRGLLIFSFVLLCSLRVALWLVPFSLLQRLSERSRRTVTPPGPVDVQRIRWAVDTAGGLWPHATCLPRAMAAQMLLARKGARSEIRLGVRWGIHRKFEAHAWLEQEGGPVIGGLPDLSRYARLQDHGQDAAL